MSLKNINQLIDRAKSDDDVKVSIRYFDEALDALNSSGSLTENTKFRYAQHVLRYKLSLHENVNDEDNIAICHEAIAPRDRNEDFKKFTFLAPYFRKKKDFEKSIEYYKKLVVLNPNFAGFYFNQMSCAIFAAGDHIRALTYAKYALIAAMDTRNETDRKKSIVNFGLIYRKMGRTELSNLFFARAYRDFLDQVDPEKKTKKSDFFRQFPFLKEDEIQLKVIQTPMKDIPAKVKFLSFFVKNIVPLCNTNSLNAMQGFWLRPFGSKKVRIDFTKMIYTDRLNRVAKCDITVYRPREYTKNPNNKRLLPVMIFFHGGGYVLGKPNQIDPYFKKIVEAMDIVIFALDYRKAPKYKLPAAIWDVYAMLEWVRDHARSWGGDIARVTVSGESAGGHMTILASHWLRDGQYEVFPKDHVHMIPIYPSVEGTFTSCLELKDAIFVSEKMVNYFVALAKPDYSVILKDEEANGIPHLMHKTENLPTTMIVVAEYCLLQLEGQIYYDEIRKSNPNTKMELLFMEKEVHGYITPALASNPDSHPKTIREVVRSIKERFGIGIEEEVEGEDEEDDENEDDSIITMIETHENT